MKGAFVLKADSSGKNWEVGGPYFPGRAIYAFSYDGRKGRNRLWAAVNSSYWGSYLSSSNDFGKNWTEPETYGVKFPEDAENSVKQIWQIVAGNAAEPNTLYCGVEPAALFRSDDAGETWSLVKGLYDHPHRPRWQPGGGGLCLHTIVPDAANRRRLFVAISTGGVYRSDDGGDSWQDIANGVPSDFGFAMVMHPHDADTVYIVPIESDEFRCTPEGKLRVYRTRNAGASWEPLTRGLPQKDALETVLRDAMAADRLNPAGVYFGTRSGQLWGSSDGGASWRLIRSGLPPIVCVRAAVIGDARRARVPKPRAKATTRPRRAKAAARRKPARKPKPARRPKPARARAGRKKK